MPTAATKTPHRRPYSDRIAAGDALADALTAYAGRDDVVVLGLPRGGVPVAARVATRLGARLGIVVARKIAAPVRRELAMGAVAVVGDSVEVYRDDYVVDRVRATAAQFDAARAAALAELRERVAVLAPAAAAPVIAGHTVIIVDDGIATGSTVRAAAACLREQRPRRLVAAAPIASARALAVVRTSVDEATCPWLPEVFTSVSQGYRDFAQLDDDDVVRVLRGDAGAS